MSFKSQSSVGIYQAWARQDSFVFDCVSPMKTNLFASYQGDTRSPVSKLYINKSETLVELETLSDEESVTVLYLIHKTNVVFWHTEIKPFLFFSKFLLLLIITWRQNVFFSGCWEDQRLLILVISTLSITQSIFLSKKKGRGGWGEKQWPTF